MPAEENFCKWMKSAEALLIVLVLNALNSVLEPVSDLFTFNNLLLRIWWLWKVDRITRPCRHGNRCNVRALHTHTHTHTHTMEK